MNSILVVSVVLAWVLILAGLWLGWQLLRQNGRLLLRIESLEERLNEMEFAEVPPEGLPVGSPAPEFDLPDLPGARHSLAQWRTQPLLLIFFNPDCGFCRELMPRLTSVAAGFQPAVEGGILPPGKDAQLPGSQTNSVNAPSSQAASAGLEARLNGRQGCLPPQLLLITTGDAEKNRQFFSEHQVISPVLLQKDSEVATAYQAAGTPTGYLISADGKIASELAIGAEALLELANGSPQPSTLNHQPTDDRASRFSSRSLARSRIARNGLKAGTPAPPFRLPRLDGRGELALEDLRGHQVLLVFSDPHCGPCQALAPQLEQLHREHPELRVVMISRGEPRDNRAKVKQFKLTFPIVLQQHWEVSRRYAMFATPIGYLIDERGIVLRDVALGAEGVMQLVPPVAGGRNLSSPQLA
jgi:peroxiredoxin